MQSLSLIKIIKCCLIKPFGDFIILVLKEDKNRFNWRGHFKMEDDPSKFTIRIIFYS